MTKSTKDKDLLTSLRRTVIPMFMGWLGSLPIAPFVDSAEVERALVVVIGAAYYGALRWLESNGIDAAGWWIAFGRTPKPAYLDNGGE